MLLINSPIANIMRASTSTTRARLKPAPLSKVTCDAAINAVAPPAPISVRERIIRGLIEFHLPGEGKVWGCCLLMLKDCFSFKVQHFISIVEVASTGLTVQLTEQRVVFSRGSPSIEASRLSRRELRILEINGRP